MIRADHNLKNLHLSTDTLYSFVSIEGKKSQNFRNVLEGRITEAFYFRKIKTILLKLQIYAAWKAFQMNDKLK